MAEKQKRFISVDSVTGKPQTSPKKSHKLLCEAVGKKIDKYLPVKIETIITYPDGETISSDWETDK